MPDRSLPPIARRHLDALTGPLGIWQHASGTQPSLEFGTCTDDVSRALTLDLLQARSLGWDVVAPTAGRSVEFLAQAFDPTTGGFRNFRDADGAWLDAAASHDSQGRALLALGIAARDTPDPELRRRARSLFTAGLPAAERLTSPRAIASVILGCDAALGGARDPKTTRTLLLLAERLRRPFQAAVRAAAADTVGGADAWPWPESALTYENALLPHALIAAGRRLGDADLRDLGLGVLVWLLDVQTAPSGCFSPIGNQGWYPRGGRRSRFDQQPIEATATILAAATAFEVTQDARFLRAAEVAYDWFLGQNDAGLVVAVVSTGGCHDGLAAAEVNRNQGAESTLMWGTALESMRRLRAAGSLIAVHA